MEKQDAQHGVSQRESGNDEPLISGKRKLLEMNSYRRY